MILDYKGIQVEVELASNSDGYKFILCGHEVESGVSLSEYSLDELQEMYDDVINANWG